MVEPGPSQQMEVVEVPANAERGVQIGLLFKILDIIIIQAGDDIAKKLKDDDASEVIDIDFSNELSGVLMTIFTCLRKKKNPKPTTFAKYEGYTAKIGEKTVSIGGIITLIEQANINLDFMTATPIIELMTLFRNSFDEVRNGVTKFQVRTGTKGASKKVSGANNRVVWEQNLSSYGLNNNHIPLVQGITFPPERRTGLIRSLGPMAQAILLVQETQYTEKIESALKNSLQMLPMGTEIARCLREARSPGPVQSMLNELGNLLLLTSARSTQKVYLPLLMLRKMWNTDYQNYLKWSFSGVGIMQLYNVIASRCTLKMKSAGVADHISQGPL